MRTAVKGTGVTVETRDISLAGRILAGARELQELADDPVHLLDVVDHAGARRVVASTHLDAEAQARERCPQVVRDRAQKRTAHGLGFHANLCLLRLRRQLATLQG